MNKVNIFQGIITGLLYPAILGALLYNIFEYMNDTKNKFQTEYHNAILKRISNTAKHVISIRHFLLVLFFFFYFFNFLRISYIDADYNFGAFLFDIITDRLKKEGFAL